MASNKSKTNIMFSHVYCVGLRIWNNLMKREFLNRGKKDGVLTLKQLNRVQLRFYSDVCTSGKKLNQEISGLKSKMMRSFASVVSTEVKQSAKIINEDLKNVRKTLNDVADAKEREANAMLLRLGEGLDDKDRVTKMIAKLTDDTVNGKNILKVFRLGKRGKGVVRPILIKFDDVKSKEYFFTNLYKLRSLNDDFAHVKLIHDLTVDQRKKLKRILDDAKARETNCKEGFLYRVRGEVGRWKIVKFPVKKESN
ncbi:hypothetical protein HELRODRAFT_165359 [Helobdella robusta]|uniref:Uncharacterized protein n=1 Tax=Helobdella robusta TaxID=6412 RepID=T1EWM9_HELRO|nr:hypothetical protein HELRODRAFT_165359 [Helobdella robusta]ESN91337.1 hypothetical protein HELRODRAFT_165359 [Helobdella robusta]